MVKTVLSGATLLWFNPGLVTYIGELLNFSELQFAPLLRGSHLVSTLLMYYGIQINDAGKVFQKVPGTYYIFKKH